MWGWVIVASGLFSLAGAAFDWEWFMNHRKARIFLALFGRKGTRIFYGMLGVLIVIAGVAVILQPPPESSGDDVGLEYP